MWNQHQAHHGHHQLHPSMEANHQKLPPPCFLLAPRPDMATASAAGMILPVSGGAGAPMGGSSVRPSSMAERARMAKIPQPEPGLKCPRCDSTNTKFCYFNNYSLTQPRHFCKACRRYWTRGGALRNVPVGGGCRRNKRSNKPSKKPVSSSGTSPSSAAVAAAGVMAPHAQLQLPFDSLHHHPLACDGGHGIVGSGASRLGFPELSSMHPAAAVDYQLGGDGLGLERPRLQLPFLTRANTGVQTPPPGSALMSAGISYPFGDVDVEAAGGLSFGGDMPANANVAGSSRLISQMASVKMDDIENPTPSVATSSPREFLGLRGSLQFWGNASGGSHRGGGDGAGGSAAPAGGAWSDLPAFDLSTSGNIL